MALPVWNARLSRLAGRPLTDTDHWRLTALAFLHDIGKCSAGFWLKQFDGSPDQHSGERDTSLRKRLARDAGIEPAQCGHTSVTLDLVKPVLVDSACGALPLETICHDWNAELFLWAAVSHHGEPIRPDYQSDTVTAPGAWRTCEQLNYDPFAQLRLMGDAARKLFSPAFQAAEPLPAPGLDEEEHQSPHNNLIHAFAGLVSLADWIASNPAPDYFPYDLAPDAERWGAALERANAVLKKMRLDVADATAALRRQAPRFGDVFREDEQCFAPTATQAAMADPNLGQIVIVEDETGAGKTEAALWRFKTLLEAGEVDSLAFLLPTRVAAVALRERIDRFLTALFPDAAVRPNSVLALPGYLVSDGLRGERLPGFEVHWPDAAREQSAHRHWAAENSKRYLAAAVAVGTVDQALLGTICVRHAHLRGACALRSLLVIDEVHASDAYMLQLIEHLLARQQRAGGHALLLSATLGGAARDRLLRPLDLEAQKARAKTDVVGNSYLAAPYPCVSDSCTGLRDTARGDARQKHVHIDTLPAMADAQAVAAEAAHAVQAGARVLVVRNTVDGAVAVQAAIEAKLGMDHPALFRCKGVVCPHHGRYAATDRRHMDQAVSKAFGKGSPSGARVIVGTQTLEQSLDIDADYLITDLCPVDVLLQRIGRLHRHAQRHRPAGYERAKVLVITPDQRDLTTYTRDQRPGKRHGIGGKVYSNVLTIEATLRLIVDAKDGWNIPADNRWLVESATHPVTLHQLADTLGEPWQAHARAMTGEALARQNHGNTEALDWATPYDAWTEAKNATTRLGDPARLVRFEPTIKSPFGIELREIQIPHWLVGKPEDDEAFASEIDAANGMVRFMFAKRSYEYTASGLKRID